MKAQFKHFATIVINKKIKRNYFYKIDKDNNLIFGNSYNSNKEGYIINKNNNTVKFTAVINPHAYIIEFEDFEEYNAKYNYLKSEMSMGKMFYFPDYEKRDKIVVPQLHKLYWDIISKSLD